MNSALTQASKNGQLISFVEKLVFNPDMFIKQMTSENDYNKLVKNAQTKAAAYYKSIWANKDAEWILNTLQAGAKNNQDYYRWMMGDAAYQSMFDKAQASWKKVKQTGNPYYGK